MASERDTLDFGARRARGAALTAAGGDPALRLTVLATFNLDLLPPYLVEALDRAGLAAAVTVAPFGQLEAPLADPGSPLYAAAPDAVVLVPAPDDLGPEPAARIDELNALIDVLLERLPRTTCFVVAFGSDELDNPNVLDPDAPERGQGARLAADAAVRALGHRGGRVVVVDWDWHVRMAGRDAVADPRLWYLARMRLGPEGLGRLADLLAEHVAAQRGAVRKVCAFDLDGVLWGGVVGEDGLGGIELGEDGRGRAFQDLQHELLRLRAAGTLLVACSKNNQADALEVFDRHPGMLVRRKHLSAFRIDWADKAANLEAIAAELGLSLDSFVFLDDSPFERERVASALPQVLVPPLADDPVERPRDLARAPWFRRVALTAADAARADAYRAEGRRRELRASVSSLDEFLRSLEQRARFERVDAASVGRAAQLTQRTNQFNLTTRRYAPAELEAELGDPEVEAWTLSLADRLGSSGVTGLALLRLEGDTATIDTFLLSCRVLGRRVEDALLAFVAERAAERGARTLVGRYVPTQKNGQVAGFFPDRGFAPRDDGAFALDLDVGRPPWPDAVAVEVAADA